MIRSRNEKICKRKEVMNGLNGWKCVHSYILSTSSLYGTCHKLLTEIRRLPG